MVTPTSHFFAFHWLQFTSICCLFPIGYFPKPTSMSGRICHHSPSSTTSIGQGDIPIITLLILYSARWSCQQHPPIHNTCGHGDIPEITQILSIYLSTTSAVFTPAGHVKTSPLAQWVKCSPMTRETWVQFQVASYQRLLKWYLIPPCLTLSNIRYVSRVKWSNPWKEVAPSPTPRCSSYWKRSLRVALDYGRQFYLLMAYQSL